MSIENVNIDILEILTKSKKQLSLNEISKILNKEYSLKYSPRQLLRYLNGLKDCSRVLTYGNGMLTKYSITNPIVHYRKYEFIYVHKGNEIAGILFRLDDVFRFFYANDFIINRSDQIPVIELQLDFYDYTEIPAVFEENIPEGINKEILELKTKVADEFELLPLLNNNIGNVYFTKTGESIKYEGIDRSPSFLQNLDSILGENPLINILDGFDINMDEEQLFPEDKDLSKLNIKIEHGISGYQYKRLVDIDFENKNIVFDETQTKDYILKPYSKVKASKDSEYYFPHIGINEHIFMSFAKNTLGLRVPYSAIFKRDEDLEYHYLVKRFDRYGLYRYAKSTFAAFLGLRSENKYETTSEKMFKRIVIELISPKERMELLKHYVYSSLIKYEDMHTKNLSLIFDKGKVLFAPLYDICTTGIYQISKGYESHITINGKKTNIRPNDFKSLCQILKVNFVDFKKNAREIAKKFESEFPLYINEVEKLGNIPFYGMKQKVRAGDAPRWVANEEPQQLVDILRKYHTNRVKELIDTNWIEE